MTSRTKVDVNYTQAGEPRLKVRLVAPKASDITAGRRKASKSPEVKPRAYLTILQATISGYLNVRAETVPVDDTTGLIFVVTTKLGRHVDSWAEIDIEPGQPVPGPGYRAIASTRTPWNAWVAPSGDFEHAATAQIMRACGIKHPLQAI